MGMLRWLVCHVCLLVILSACYFQCSIAYLTVLQLELHQIVLFTTKVTQ